VTGPPDLSLSATRLRAALTDHLEDVMTVTDTERALDRFREGVKHDRKRRGLLVAAASVAVVAAAGAVYLSARDGGSATVAAGGGAGSMVLDLSTYSDMGVWDATNQSEARDSTWTGTLSVTTADGELTGAASLIGAAGLVETSTGPNVYHSWGSVEATLKQSECLGSYGVSFYREPRETGGAIQLSCSDGSVLAAKMVVEDISPLGGSWRQTLRLEDVAYSKG